jgi:molybdopterin converting factor small subunit
MNKEKAEMNIGLKCFATLAEADKCDYKGSTSKTLPDGSTVRKLLIEAAINEKDVKLIFVNGQQAALDKVLHDGDQVGLAPAVGGM